MEKPPSAPALPGLTWRTISIEDLPALGELAAACQQSDGGLAFRNTPETLRERFFSGSPGIAAGALTDGGQLAACATVHVQSDQEQASIAIAGLVHPGYRNQGIGTYLMLWSLQQAGFLLAGIPGQQRVVQIATEALTEPANRLYLRHGFIQVHESLVMQSELNQPLPEQPFPEGVTISAWQPGLIEQFYQAYTASFRDRPGFPGWSLAEWASWTTGEDGNFRPEWSFLARLREEPAGFLTAVEEPPHGFVVQVGVVPAMRRRGFGSALMNAAMRRMQAERIPAALLTVHINNPGAIQVYKKLSYEVVGRRARFERSLEP